MTSVTRAPKTSSATSVPRDHLSYVRSSSNIVWFAILDSRSQSSKTRQREKRQPNQVYYIISSSNATLYSTANWSDQTTVITEEFTSSFCDQLDASEPACVDMHSMADLTLYGNDGTYDKNETKPATASLTTRIDDIGFGLGPAEPSLDLSSFLDGQSTPAVDELLEGFYFGGAAPPVPTPVALVTVAREFIDLPTIKVEPTDFSTQQRWKSFVDTEHSYYTSGASSSSCSPPRAAATPGPVAATPGLAAATPGTAAATPGTAAATPGPAPAAGGKKSASKKRAAPKGSVQYVERRERNNLAVRKSRQKSKQHNVAMGRRVQELAAHNHSLQTKVDQLTKELDMLKQLFSVAVKDGASAR